MLVYSVVLGLIDFSELLSQAEIASVRYRVRRNESKNREMFFVTGEKIRSSSKA